MAIRPAVDNIQVLLALALDTAADLVAGRHDDLDGPLTPRLVERYAPDAVAILRALLHLEAPDAAELVVEHVNGGVLR